MCFFRNLIKSDIKNVLLAYWQLVNYTLQDLQWKKVLVGGKQLQSVDKKSDDSLQMLSNGGAWYVDVRKRQTNTF